MSLETEIWIEEYAKKAGMLEVGICTPEPFEEIREKLEQKNKALKGFVEQNLELRINPANTMPEIKSIIVFALGYRKNFLFSIDKKLRGRFSMGAIGLDYHIKLKQALEGMANELQKKQPFQYRIFVDTGPLCDRAVAERAKIGFLAKNGSLCSENGSMLFLGMMMTDLPLTPTIRNITESCGNCRLCIDACPGKALDEAGSFYPERCISYLTQKKGILNQQERKWIGRQLYGCDICQLVCPKNKNQKSEPIWDIQMAMPELEKILYLSNKGFQKQFGQTACGWRGKNILQRNALIALGNTPCEEAEKIVARYQEEERELIRETAKGIIKEWT